MIFLTDAEVDEMSEGRTQNAARIKFLQSLGLTVNRKPNGRPLVLRAHAESVLAGMAVADAAAAAAPATVAPGPDRGALVQFLAERRRRR